MRADNSAHIVTAARHRTADARSRAVTALRRLDADGQPVTFSTVASAARVSRSWLYAQDDLREQIGRLRTRQQQARHHRRFRTGSARRPPRCCAAWKQPPPASASWNQRTASCATRSSAHSANSGQRRSAHQLRHARKAENRKITADLRRDRRKCREQHCPRHKAPGQKASRSPG
jgi:hypothetical protein